MKHVIPDHIQEVYKFTPDEVRRLQMIAEHYGLTIAQCFSLSCDMERFNDGACPAYDRAWRESYSTEGEAVKTRKKNPVPSPPPWEGNVDGSKDDPERASEFVSLYGEDLVDDLPEVKVRELLKRAIRADNARELARVERPSIAMVARGRHLSRNLRDAADEIDKALIDGNKLALRDLILAWEAKP